MHGSIGEKAIDSDPARVVSARRGEGEGACTANESEMGDFPVARRLCTTAMHVGNHLLSRKWAGGQVGSHITALVHQQA
jgi:hypothetical protein